MEILLLDSCALTWEIRSTVSGGEASSVKTKAETSITLRVTSGYGLARSNLICLEANWWYTALTERVLMLSNDRFALHDLLIKLELGR